jgi:hypothetical protein
LILTMIYGHATKECLSVLQWCSCTHSFVQFVWGTELRMLVRRPTRCEAVESHACMDQWKHKLRFRHSLFYTRRSIILGENWRSSSLYQWIEMLFWTWLTTVITRRSPSLATMRGPGNFPLTVTMLLVWQRRVTFCSITCKILFSILSKNKVQNSFD